MIKGHKNVSNVQKDISLVEMEHNVYPA